MSLARLRRPLAPENGESQHRHAAHRVDAALDQVGDERIGREVHRRRGVAQGVEQRAQARRGHHRQREVHDVDPLALHELRQLFQPSQHPVFPPRRQALVDAIVDETHDLQVAVHVLL